MSPSPLLSYPFPTLPTILSVHLYEKKNARTTPLRKIKGLAAKPPIQYTQTAYQKVTPILNIFLQRAERGAGETIVLPPLRQFPH